MRSLRESRQSITRFPIRHHNGLVYNTNRFVNPDLFKKGQRTKEERQMYFKENVKKFKFLP